MSASKPIAEIGETPLVPAHVDAAFVSNEVCRVTEKPAPIGWWLVFGLALMFLGVLGVSVGWLFWNGIGSWGNNSPIAWAWDITNFVWWIGIGHAGTLISAVLFLFRQKWRTSVNRFSEAMTIFAVICALLYPTIHVGRVWVLYWALPLPNQMSMWPNFKSPLLWDVFAVSTYFTVSLLYWYLGLVPDFATLRDRAKNVLRKRLYGAFALGWRGSNRHWRNYERAYLILAGLSTPLVLSVHSVVSFDFATSVMPGWHTTIFPPYFVAGAVFSGFAMVMTLMIISRQVYGLKELMTMKHLEMMNKIMLVTGSLVGYAYSMEFFIAWYSGNEYEKYVFINRATGPYWWAYWTMITCNVISPQLFWFKRFRTSIPVMFAISIVINIGMWFERFVIIVTSLHRDYLPSSWGMFSPTLVDIGCFTGSLGLFFTLFSLFIRWLPMIAMFEVKGALPDAQPSHGHAHADGEHVAGAHGTLAAKEA
ncbi:MAG TPA: NrfD/PsrC family molybdoenzyme membrane anchor subunit [Polyangiales bacterium]|nr:NrfD/PsrC family molybdoenzyme membrane anchor subunit [Polyangiales bacterium]